MYAAHVQQCTLSSAAASYIFLMQNSQGDNAVMVKGGLV